MNIVVPIEDGSFSDDGEFVSTGSVIGFEVRSPFGVLLGRGESIEAATEQALKRIWAPMTEA
jgi:hypothetical protein